MGAWCPPLPPYHGSSHKFKKVKALLIRLKVHLISHCGQPYASRRPQPGHEGNSPSLLSGNWYSETACLWLWKFCLAYSHTWANFLWSQNRYFIDPRGRCSKWRIVINFICSLEDHATHNWPPDQVGSAFFLHTHTQKSLTTLGMQICHHNM